MVLQVSDVRRGYSKEQLENYWKDAEKLIDSKLPRCLMYDPDKKTIIEFVEFRSLPKPVVERICEEYRKAGWQVDINNGRDGSYFSFYIH